MEEFIGTYGFSMTVMAAGRRYGTGEISESSHCELRDSNQKGTAGGGGDQRLNVSMEGNIRVGFRTL